MFYIRYYIGHSLGYSIGYCIRYCKRFSMGCVYIYIHTHTHIGCMLEGIGYRDFKQVYIRYDIVEGI